MPITYLIDHARGQLVATAKGEISLRDIETYLDEILVAGAMPYCKLFDASEASAILSDKDMMVLGAQVSAYKAFDPRGPLAIVVGSDQTEELAARFLNLHGAIRPGAMFATVDEGLRWLEHQVALAKTVREAETRDEDFPDGGPLDKVGALYFAVLIDIFIRTAGQQGRWVSLQGTLERTAAGKESFLEAVNLARIKGLIAVAGNPGHAAVASLTRLGSRLLK
jgi:hypothetical protein